MMARQRNRSDSYQYRMVEVAIDPSVLCDFSTEDGFGEQMRTSGFSEEILDLRKILMKEVRRLIETILTPRQCEVITLRLQGYTQVEIADMLGIHQTTVHKTLSGNIDYKNGEARYGGAIKKLKKACSKDPKVSEILRKIEETRIKENEEIDPWSNKGQFL